MIKEGEINLNGVIIIVYENNAGKSTVENFAFEEEKSTYKFVKNNKEIQTENTAAGIKAFGLLEPLLKNRSYQ